MGSHVVTFWLCFVLNFLLYGFIAGYLIFVTWPKSGSYADKVSFRPSLAIVAVVLLSQNALVFVATSMISRSHLCEGEVISVKQDEAEIVIKIEPDAYRAISPDLIDSAEQLEDGARLLVSCNVFTGAPEKVYVLKSP